MTLAELEKAFAQEVKRPECVQGDSWGVDATTEEITRLVGSQPDQLKAEDFLNYLGYCTTGGDDDLRYLIPPIVRIWESELYRRDSYFTQSFHAEICRTGFVERALSDSLRKAMTGFMIRALLERVNSENSLRVEGASTSHVWFGCLASFGVYSRDFGSLWSQLWKSEARGHAVALLQYLSCLLFDDDENPIFAPWTSRKGGGSPELWGYDSVGFEERWKEENLDCLLATLCPDEICAWLKNARERFGGGEIAEMAKTFLDRLEADPQRIDVRCTELIFALSLPSGTGGVTWEWLREILDERAAAS